MGTLVLTEDDNVACVNITIISDSRDEQDRECFAFVISTAASDSVSVEIPQATVCITDDDGTKIIKLRHIIKL